MTSKSFIGPIIHSTAPGKLAILENARIDIKDGTIQAVTLNPNTTDVEPNVMILKKGQILIPGFVDGHIHAVQVPNIGLGYDKPLLEWLKTYTFPLEKKFTDQEFSDSVYDAVVKKTLQVGTTTACYFASLYKDSSLILANKAAKYGQRAFIGKVNMNDDSESDYFENTVKSITETKEFIEAVEKISSPLVKPIITPRFALSCDMELMSALADIAKEKKLHIQTHIAENKDEVKEVGVLFSKYPSYTDVYDAAGLLTNKTVLAHGIYLSDEELATINSRDTAVIHCPTSNTCLKSGLCDVRKLQAANVAVGLGTDVSGGNSMSILDTMRAALEVSIHISFSKKVYKPLDYKDVFYLATLGGAAALSLDDQIGNFEVGKQFDALIIDLNAGSTQFNNFLDYTLEQQFQRFIYCGDDRNIAKVYVSGKQVV